MKCCPECGNGDFIHRIDTMGESYHRVSCTRCGNHAECVGDRAYHKLWNVEFADSEKIDYKVCKHLKCKNYHEMPLPVKQGDDSDPKQPQCLFGTNQWQAHLGNIRMPMGCPYQLEHIAAAHQKGHRDESLS